MIQSREELRNYIKADVAANWREDTKVKIFGDDGWNFIVTLRKKEYYESFSTGKKICCFIPVIVNKIRLYRLAVKCGYTIPANVCGKGLGLPHRGTIVINTTARIGMNCRIHEGVTIGSTSGSKQAAIIGNNVFIGSGAKIIGAITIADDVAIGANAVVVKDILEPGTTWAGNPARKISDRNSHSNLAPKLFQKEVD